MSSLRFLALWISLVCAFSQALYVEKPCCSVYPHAGANFGPQLPWTNPGVFGVLSRALDKDCQGGVPGTIVMIDRGMESFVDSVKACQDRGAVAVVVRNVVSSGGAENDLVVMSSPHQEPDIRVPSVFISRRSGDELDAILATQPIVFVQLFAADDVNYLMAYLAYLVMSVETLFFAMLVFSIAILLWTRRMFRRNGSSRRCCCRRPGYSRVALLVQNRSLTEPLQGTSNNAVADGEDIENKLRQGGRESSMLVYPVVYSNGDNEHSVHISVDPHNQEPVFEQQEQ